MGADVDAHEYTHRPADHQANRCTYQQANDKAHE